MPLLIIGLLRVLPRHQSNGLHHLPSPPQWPLPQLQWQPLLLLLPKDPV